MKKLYFLDEEEKGRILNLHESATKNQYLSEQVGVGQTFTPPSWATTEVEKAIVDPAKKAERIKNISKIVCSLDGDKITTKGSQFNGKSWVDYVTKFKITSAEEAQAKKLCSTGGDERLYNIAKIACNVDASGKIVNPKSKFNGKMFTDYISTYKLTGAEVEKAKTLCGKLGNVPTADVGKFNSPANVGSKGSKGNKGSSTASIAPNIQAVQKQLGIQNGTGTLDTATLQAMLSKLNSGVQAAAPAAGTPVQSVSTLTPAGIAPVSNTQSQLGMTSDQLNNTIKQLQANANRPV
jgi:hypothetical protein